MTYGTRVLAISGEKAIGQEMLALGVSPAAVAHMAAKGQFFLLRADGLSPVAANILKQDMLSRGGEAAVHAGVIVHKVEQSSVLLMGTLSQYESLIPKLRQQQFGLPKLAEEIQAVLDSQRKEPAWSIPYPGGCLEIGKRTLVMGIVNVTPDSFSDGGNFFICAAGMVRRNNCRIGYYVDCLHIL